MVAISMRSPTTIGRFSPMQTAKMVACSGLITASKALMTYMPRFEMDVVPPWYSCGASPHLIGNLGQRFHLCVPHDRREKATLDRHRHANVAVLVTMRALLHPARVGRRDLLQCHSPRLADEIVNGQFERPRPVFRRR